MNTSISNIPLSKAEIARRLGVSRTYVTLLAQGKRKPSKEMVDKLTSLGLTVNLNAFQDANSCTGGPLAQLAEQLTLNQPVGGSSPPRLTMKLGNRLTRSRPQR